MNENKITFLQLMHHSPFKNVELDLEREDSDPREIDLSGEENP